MSAQSKGTASSSSSPSEGPPTASKAKVKEQIKIIVEDLELVLGDLKDVAKELKEAECDYRGHVRKQGNAVAQGKEFGCPFGDFHVILILLHNWSTDGWIMH
ncbi:hypothetical protein DUI87_26413 [Hirundo rustica rustica]|uniref:Uncharacterized protein n=1 Tax=Hirundo rustica rustica TaxID=333673 RepID=A0A3M0JEL1_HIRRU|nr:hypothetical protein DUI87_26413 [Hirundo rustica rustica]